MGRIQGKVAIITGAGHGIGRACAERFAREGAKVFGISRTQPGLDAMRAAVAAAGGEAAAATADLSSAEQTEHAITQALETFGRVDILVNVAGVGYSWAEKSPGSMNDVATTPVDKWHEVININLGSVYNTCRVVVPRMQKQGGGNIVNVGSIFGVMGVADGHAYTAAKGAVINLTRSLAIAYTKDGIRSNCVCPGYVDTGMIASVMHYFDDAAVAPTLCPMQRAGRPEEIASACLFMASDDASYCNGAILMVDGGTTAH